MPARWAHDPAPRPVLARSRHARHLVDYHPVAVAGHGRHATLGLVMTTLVKCRPCTRMILPWRLLGLCSNCMGKRRRGEQ